MKALWAISVSEQVIMDSFVILECSDNGRERLSGFFKDWIFLIGYISNFDHELFFMRFDGHIFVEKPVANSVFFKTNFI